MTTDILTGALALLRAGLLYYLLFNLAANMSPEPAASEAAAKYLDKRYNLISGLGTAFVLSMGWLW